MFKQLWQQVLGSPAQRKFTLDELRDLYTVLIKNPVVTESNRALVVETIRAIAEFMIWGDQNEPRIFDYLLENNIMTYLHKILLQPSNRAGDVAKQVLQTLSIIIQNVRSETAIFFLFSNNHVNNIVDLDFDFEDEEVLGFYVSFLKTISLKLNPTTVHFFLVDADGGPAAATPTLPLYSRATALAHNREGMVRAAVRTVTLNIFSVDDPAIHAFVAAPPASNYFGAVAAYLAEQVALLDRRMAAAEAGGPQALAALDSQMAEVEDIVSYCSDTLSIGVPGIAELLAQGLWSSLVSPMLLRPLLAPGAAAAAAVPLAGASAVPLSARAAAAAAAAGSAFGGSMLGRGAGGASGDGGKPPPRVRPVCCLFVLERLFVLLSHPPLLHQMLLALACGEPGGGGGGASCRRTLLEVLGGEQPYPALLALRLVVSVLGNRHLSAELLAALSLLPRRRLAGGGSSLSPEDARALLQACLEQLRGAGLCNSAAEPPGPRTSSGSGASASGGREGGAAEVVALLTQRYLPSQLQALSQSAASSSSGGGSGGGGGNGRGGARQQQEAQRQAEAWAAAELAQLSVSGQQQQQQARQQQPRGSWDAAMFASVGDELRAALVRLLPLPGLPALGLWLVSYLLHQLLPAAPPPPAPPLPHGASSVALSDILPGGGGAGGGGGGSGSEGGDDGLSSQAAEDAGGGGEAAAFDGVSVASSSRAPSSVLPGGGGAAAPQAAAGAAATPSLPTPAQAAAVAAALGGAQAAFKAHLGGIWCEALGPMVALEWPAAREQMQRPVLRASSEALLSGPHACGPAAAAGGGGEGPRAGGAAAGKGDGLSQSAREALACYMSVQRVVALLQLSELLSAGAVPKSPPIATLTDAELRQADVQEGFSVDLHPAASIPAVVSFTPGLERRVFFSIAGVALRRADAAAAAGGGGGGWSSAADRALLRSLPVTVVADPSPTKPNAGVVLSVAPLLGADPTQDANVPKWLHVHVRPSVRGLLRVLKAASAKKGGLLNSMRQLADGHWVLAFAEPDKSAAAMLLVQQHAVTLRAAYSRHLAPLTGDGAAAAPSAGGGAPAAAAAEPAPPESPDGAAAAAAAAAGAAAAAAAVAAEETPQPAHATAEAMPEAAAAGPAAAEGGGAAGASASWEEDAAWAGDAGQEPPAAAAPPPDAQPPQPQPPQWLHEYEDESEEEGERLALFIILIVAIVVEARDERTAPEALSLYLSAGLPRRMLPEAGRGRGAAEAARAAHAAVGGSYDVFRLRAGLPPAAKRRLGEDGAAAPHAAGVADSYGVFRLRAGLPLPAGQGAAPEGAGGGERGTWPADGERPPWEDWYSSYGT
ncbi:MAG: hypothetical protein J3K34DRAFT_520884 [Monoraphidium minutum]|nr:MAG: hypothetical protein J3K34DRAFT_520884 [Monoraphidium minutum]